MSDRPTSRFLGLDALRGLAILLMCLNGVVPYSGLPNWLYHGYEPRWLPTTIPAESWAAVDRVAVVAKYPAFTVIDFVFPAFLFAMGVAIPMALALRKQRGESNLSMFGGVLGRWTMLVLFAMYCQQVKPGMLGKENGQAGLWLSLLGFLMLFPALVRLPDILPRGWKAGVRLFGFFGCGLLLIVANTRSDAPAFAWRTWGNVDGIILILAHTYLLAAVSWMVLPWAWVRLAVLMPVMISAHYLTLSGAYAEYRWIPAAWVSPAAWDQLYAIGQWPRSLLSGQQWVDWFTGGRLQLRPPFAAVFDLSTLYEFTWLKYLWLVVPGTMVGDALRRRSVASPTADSRRPILTPLLMGATACLIVFAGLRHYGYPSGWPAWVRTPWLAAWAVPACAAWVWQTWRSDAGGSVHRLLIGWASATLSAGLVLCILPQASTHNGFFEGGISKGPPGSMSYFLVSIGVSLILLSLFTRLIDERRTRWLNLLVYSGQNPLMAYLGPRILLPVLCSTPLLAPLINDAGKASTLDGFVAARLVGNDPWLGLVWAFMKLSILALFVGWFSRRKIFWRA
jgi:predicted acyltransferase